jgi:WD40 repeat protein
MAAGGEYIFLHVNALVTHPLGDGEKVLVWDIATRKRKHILEDSAHHWGQITCLSWLGDQYTDGLAVLAFGMARGHVVMYRQSRTEVGV